MARGDFRCAKKMAFGGWAGGNRLVFEFLSEWCRFVSPAGIFLARPGISFVECDLAHRAEFFVIWLRRWGAAETRGQNGPCCSISARKELVMLNPFRPAAWILARQFDPSRAYQYRDRKEAASLVRAIPARLDEQAVGPMIITYSASSRARLRSDISSTDATPGTVPFSIHPPRMKRTDDCRHTFRPPLPGREENRAQPSPRVAFSPSFDRQESRSHSDAPVPARRDNRAPRRGESATRAMPCFPEPALLKCLIGLSAICVFGANRSIRG